MALRFLRAGTVGAWFAAVGLAACGALAGGDAQAAGGAYQVDTSEVSDSASCKLESWVSWASNRDFFAAASPSCAFNIGKPLEVSSQFSRSRTDGDWVTAVVPKAKLKLLDSGVGVFGLAVSGNAGFDLVTRQNTSLAFTVPLTMRFSEVARINLNAGWLWDRVVDRHYFTYGAGFDVRTPDNVWTLTGEMFGLIGRSDTQTVVVPRFQTGIRYRPIDRFSVDLIYGRNIAGENAHWITLATIVRFPVADK